MTSAKIQVMLFFILINFFPKSFHGERCFWLFFHEWIIKRLFESTFRVNTFYFNQTTIGHDWIRKSLLIIHFILFFSGAFNPMYTRQGYLYVQTKNKSVPFNVQLGSQWTKHYCQYQAKSKTLSMIPYTQLNGKITTSETVRVTSCVCKSEDSSEKFRFVVHGDELTQLCCIEEYNM